MVTHRYPTFLLAKATVAPEHYMAAAHELEGVPQVFLDGTTILLPESETVAIELLRTQFGAMIEYGGGQEWEFATKARAAGVQERLVRLDNAVWDVAGQPVADMIRAALEAPDATYSEWSALCLASMETH
jgi:hypothetical protein